MRRRGLVLVVGAAGGTGFEVVQQLIDRGYDVAGTVRDAAEDARVHARFPDARTLIVDLADGDAIGAALAPLLNAQGEALVGVIICAAVCPYGPLETMPLSMLRQTMEVNMVADLAVYQSCIPYLRATKGRFVVLSSFGGKLALPFIGHYVTSKFALEGLADVMRREAAQWGVNVIVIEPGGIRTSMVTDQIAVIGADIAALSPAAAELYHDRYREYRGMLESSYEKTNPPSVIAKVVVDALQDPNPQPRYTAGDDARELVEMVATSTDVEIDAYVRTLYASLIAIDRERHGSSVTEAA